MCILQGREVEKRVLLLRWVHGSIFDGKSLLAEVMFARWKKTWTWTQMKQETFGSADISSSDRCAMW